MFDRNNAAHLAQLKAEIQTDPIGMGYAAASGTRDILARLNRPALNVGAETKAPTLTAPLLMQVIAPEDLTALSAGARAWLSMLIQLAAVPGAENIDAYKVTARGLFAPSTATRQAMNNLATRQSRAETLFGDGTTIDRPDLFAARDS